MLGAWHWLLHVIGVYPPASRWASFWEGFGSGPIAWCVLPIVYLRHHNCHKRWCPFPGHAVDGVVICRRHKRMELANDAAQVL